MGEKRSACSIGISGELDVADTYYDTPTICHLNCSRLWLEWVVRWWNRINNPQRIQQPSSRIKKSSSACVDSICTEKININNFF